jgi:hypothetical protein
MGKVRASAGGALHDPSGVQGALISKGTYIDELGRTRDAGSEAIIMPGFRRIPPAADMTYVERLERHNAQLEAENNELRVCNKSLQKAKNAAGARISELEQERHLILEELDRLRAKVAVTADESRNHEITSMFLKHDNENLHSHIKQISGQNAALASGLIGTPMDPRAGQLVSASSLSDAGSDMYVQHLKNMQADMMIPPLPTIPIERAKYPLKDRVICLLAKVGVPPNGTLQWESCTVLQGAIDATESEHQAQLEAICKDLCKDGMPYEKALAHFSQVSSASLARAEKTLGLTTVHYHPFVYDPIGV